jgi:hypothetical protein
MIKASIRFHGVLRVARGKSCRQVSGLLGVGRQSVAYWARRFGRDGLAGPREEERQGRPGGPGVEQVQGIEATLRRQAEDFGLTGSLWDGKTVRVREASVGREPWNPPGPAAAPAARISPDQTEACDRQGQRRETSPGKQSSAGRQEANTSTIRRWMKFTSSSTVRDAGCGFHRTYL